MRTRRDYYLFLKVLTLSIIDIYKNILSLKEKTHFTPPYEKHIERFRSQPYISYTVSQPLLFNTWILYHRLTTNSACSQNLTWGGGRKKPWKGGCVVCCMLVAQLCPTLCHPMVCSPPGFSVLKILQARILEWVAIPFSRGSSRPRDLPKPGIKLGSPA